MNEPAVRMKSSPEQELARRFHLHVLADVEHLKARGYNPARFLSMIAENGTAVTVAKKIFANPRRASYGFERLWEMGELGRSVEFVANLPWFRALFTEDELAEAKTRLTLHDFPVEERLVIARIWTDAAKTQLQQPMFKAVWEQVLKESTFPYEHLYALWSQSEPYDPLAAVGFTRRWIRGLAGIGAF